jgi:DNA repair protein SbcC/Rad50
MRKNMRPLKLELEGFTAFREPTCLDLAELDLFAITGPTGAGKSSLIDAIAYALYGRVPRVTAEVGACISQGMDRMRVTLEFVAGEERYRIYRETRRKGAGAVRLDYWEGDEWQPQLDRAREVTECVNLIVGLDYEGFTRSVLLPQGQFQEFLAGSAEKRRAVLGSLLRLEVYNRMRGRATTMASEMKTRLDERERALDMLVDATPERMAELKREVASHEAEKKQLDQEAKAIERGYDLAVVLTRGREALAAAEAESQAASADLATTGSLIEQGDSALAEVATQIEALQKQLDGNCYDPDRMTQLTLARDRASVLEDAAKSLEEAITSHKDAEIRSAATSAAVEQGTKRVAAAEEATKVAEASLDETRRHNLVAALASGLKTGDPCPVCGGTVGELEKFDDADLDAAQQALATARRAESDARSALQNAVNAATKAAMTVETAEKRLREMEALRERTQQSLSETLGGDGAMSLTAIEEALREQARARQQRESVQAELDTASGQRERLAAQIESAREHLGDLEARVVAAGEAADAHRESVREVGGQLEALSTEQGWQDVSVAVAAEADAASPLKRRAEAAERARTDAAIAVAQLEERLSRLEVDVERAAAMRKELAALKKEHDVAADLAQMLRADRFQSYIQQEALATLAADGSSRLEQLSSGRYRLQVDEKGQEFEVIDQWNADLSRSVRTLSGGETFLASLSLSLALAESLPGLAASRRVVLDSVFLDEGFGSLDADALDRAADALDALRGENRMVCIVTHLQELAQRLPARVVVTKTESGSSVAVA